jgi:hypothetical protein
MKTIPHFSNKILLRIFEKGSEEYDPDVENVPEIRDDYEPILKSFPSRMRQVSSCWRDIIDSAPPPSQMQFRIAYVALEFPEITTIDDGENKKSSSKVPRIVDILSRFRRSLMDSAGCDLVIRFTYRRNGAAGRNAEGASRMAFGFQK